MRIAVIADIHGNALALRSVMDDIEHQKPDLVVNLGDHLSGPLDAAVTAGILMSQPHWVQIRGNHDRQLLEHAPSAMGPSDRAANSQIGEAERTWLRQLSPTAAPAEGVLLCHGTPADDLEYLLEDLSAAGPSLATPENLMRRLGGNSGAILCGHSHVARFVRLADGTVVLNPGSVGLQAYEDIGHRFPHFMENGSPHARYALLDR